MGDIDWEYFKEFEPINEKVIPMLGIEKIDHIGIRVKEKSRSTNFYQSLGFKLISIPTLSKATRLCCAIPLALSSTSLKS